VYVSCRNATAQCMFSHSQFHISHFKHLSHRSHSTRTPLDRGRKALTTRQTENKLTNRRQPAVFDRPSLGLLRSLPPSVPCFRVQLSFHAAAAVQLRLLFMSASSCCCIHSLELSLLLLLSLMSYCCCRPAGDTGGGGGGGTNTRQRIVNHSPALQTSDHKG